MDPMLSQEPDPKKRRRQAAAKKRRAQAAAKKAAQQKQAARQAQARQRQRQAAAKARSTGRTDSAQTARTRRAPAPAAGKAAQQPRQAQQTAAQRERTQRAQIRRLRAQQADRQDQEERWNQGGIPMWGRMLIAVAAVLVLLLVFFRVDRFEVTGNVRYSVDEVADASGITIGDVLMGVNKTQAASRIIVKLPYVRQVVVSKVLPGTVRFTLVECQAMAAASSEFGTVWLMNGDGKLLETLDNPAEIGYPLIQGPVLELPTAGDQIDFDDDEAGALALETVRELTEAGVQSHVRLVDLSDPENIKLTYDDRLEVQLGDGTDVAYRIQYMILAVAELGENARGSLDLSFKSTSKAIFHPLAQ